jgi:hypothetical protein
MAKIDTMQLENSLRGIKYPVTRDELISHLEQNGINEQVRQAVKQLPNQHYRSLNEVNKALESVTGNVRG